MELDDIGRIGKSPSQKGQVRRRGPKTPVTKQLVVELERVPPGESLILRVTRMQRLLERPKATPSQLRKLIKDRLRNYHKGLKAEVSEDGKLIYIMKPS